MDYIIQTIISASGAEIEIIISAFGAEIEQHVVEAVAQGSCFAIGLCMHE